MSGIDAATVMVEVAERYIAAWNEADAGARREAVAELWTDNGTYTDPLADVTGHEAIEAVISQARQQFSGYVFALRGGVDSHHDVARFNWELFPADGGEAAAIGFDVVVVTGDGRIRNVFGFLDRVPGA